MTSSQPKPRKKQVILAAGFPHGSPWIAWSDPESRSQIDFSSISYAAQAAEAGKFDFFMLAEALRQREHKGEFYDLEISGRHHGLTVLTALAAMTDHIGLVTTSSSTYNEPYELARQLSTLDHLSGGRAGWNIVTTSDPQSGVNFRRGGYLPHEQRYERAREFVAAARTLWDSWPVEAIVGDQESGRFRGDPAAGSYRHRGGQFDISGRFSLPTSPQRYPLLIQAGDSADGRQFAIDTVDVVFSMYADPQAGRAFHADIRARAIAAGRDPRSIRILPGSQCILGDSVADARERSRVIARQQITPQNAIARLEQVWGRDLSGYDPDGPVPPVLASDEPGAPRYAGYTAGGRRPPAIAREWYERAQRKGLTIRELIIDVTLRHTFLGTPSQVAEQIDEAVQSDAADGYVLTGHTTSVGLDEFVKTVVPELQERGVFRTEYTGTTLRENLGLPAPAGPAPAGWEEPGEPDRG
ncbi:MULTISPECIES: NtaA/DmoA family FMN-dependent monooxygenase [Protofrankia]|uniref:FMN-dependent oxidoreductase, nitrilotriacetate monooxygenase family n=1 Tax=Candidatus Protofrankia datiscae TaxID=2716812 RepID=F8B1G1_9ACTN|nr:MULTISPECIES: NtaA/DmoA family FMN-dependent monooxygenase [Protofrankia]AEH09835.1 FMN-dependent oxidoreductase, nitrilotriacetate monooxygenase family [Candidatus Protofrankia datiscae]